MLKIILTILIMILLAIYLVAGLYIARETATITCENITTCLREMYTNTIILLVITLFFTLATLYTAILLVLEAVEKT